MVRFKVIRGSRLLLGFSVIVLVLVVCAILLSAFLSSKSVPAMEQAELVLEEAKTETVFASSSGSNDILPLDPTAGDYFSIEIISEIGKSSAPRPRVLIYHTHSHEAYEQAGSDRYVAIEAWRTTDQDHSVVRVGTELTRLLESRGFEVVHDTTDHEQNDLQTAYTRSLATLEAYSEPFDLYIDLHRDAYIEGVSTDSLYGENGLTAQLMLLIGNGEGFEEKPFFEENLEFAEILTARINDSMPGLCRDVMIKDGRYNQHIGVFSILIEVGHNRNTLSEALSSLPYLSDALADIMIDNIPEALIEIRNKYSTAHP